MAHPPASFRRRAISAILAAAIGFSPAIAHACTGIRIVSKDDTVVRGRTMEFGVDTDSNVILVPRGTERTGTAPDGAKGKTWKAKYASLGMNALDMPVIVDGLNEKGLSVGIFYFPGYADFQPYEASDADNTVAPWEVGSYILDNFATLDEVRAGLEEIVVPNVELSQWKIVLPVHFIVMDATGAALVIEYIDGERKIFDNPLGVITNSPSFDWHLTNLNNYVNLGLENVPPNQLGDYKVPGFGQGTGLLGMPGDFTPPSRFVRAAIYSYGVLQSTDADEAVLESFHILNNFDIPRGVARDGKPDGHGNIEADYTQWTSASDLTNLRFYVRTYDNSAIRYVYLQDQDLDAKEIKVWPVSGGEDMIPLAPGK